MIATIQSAVLFGLEVVGTKVEVGFSRGIPGIAIVGLPDNAVKESRERIRLAISQTNFEYPAACKIVVNLSPADVKKEGSALDLPISVGILKNKYHIADAALAGTLFYGELNLQGDLHPVKGVLNVALYARDNGFQRLVIPQANRHEATFVKGIEIYPLQNLTQVMELVQNPVAFAPSPPVHSRHQGIVYDTDFCEIRGQYLAKRTLEIAAAGFHNTLMIGPAGAGKSMLAKALPSILPEMTDEEILETSLIYSAAGLLDGNNGLVAWRPFRTPHHTISDIGISGGGRYPVPGEISLAHNGVLFLDELPFFKKNAIEVLRQPMEDGKITISRSLHSHTFPARFMLMAAMNPCEDSLGLSPQEHYSCTDAQKRRYYARISKPILDRIDLQIEIKRVQLEEITAPFSAENSQAIRQRVEKARQIQLERFHSSKRRIFANGQMKNPEIKKFCSPSGAAQDLLNQASERFQFSARAYFKLLKVARTIADLAGQSEIEKSHIQEALQYRALDWLRF